MTTHLAAATSTTQLTTYTVRYRHGGATTWEYLEALSRLDARRRLLRLVPSAHIFSVAPAGE